MKDLSTKPPVDKIYFGIFDEERILLEGDFTANEITHLFVFFVGFFGDEFGLR